MSGYPTAYCELCGALAPCAMITLHQNVGILIVRFPQTISGQLCKRCIDDRFWRMSIISFFFGWWGVISFFYTLFTLPMNVIAWLGTWSMPTVDDPLEPPTITAAAPEPASTGSGFAALAIVGAILGTIGVLIAIGGALIGIAMMLVPLHSDDPRSGALCMAMSGFICGLPGLFAVIGSTYHLFSRQKKAR